MVLAVSMLGVGGWSAVESMSVASRLGGVPGVLMVAVASSRGPTLDIF